MDNSKKSKLSDPSRQNIDKLMLDNILQFLNKKHAKDYNLHNPQILKDSHKLSNPCNSEANEILNLNKNEYYLNDKRNNISKNSFNSNIINNSSHINTQNPIINSNNNIYNESNERLKSWNALFIQDSNNKAKIQAQAPNDINNSIKKILNSNEIKYSLNNAKISDTDLFSNNNLNDIVYSIINFNDRNHLENAFILKSKELIQTCFELKALHQFIDASKNEKENLNYSQKQNDYLITNLIKQVIPVVNMFLSSLKTVFNEFSRNGESFSKENSNQENSSDNLFLYLIREINDWFFKLSAIFDFTGGAKPSNANKSNIQSKINNNTNSNLSNLNSKFSHLNSNYFNSNEYTYNDININKNIKDINNNEINYSSNIENYNNIDKTEVIKNNNNNNNNHSNSNDSNNTSKSIINLNCQIINNFNSKNIENNNILVDKYCHNNKNRSNQSKIIYEKNENNNNINDFDSKILKTSLNTKEPNSSIINHSNTNQESLMVTNLNDSNANNDDYYLTDGNFKFKPEYLDKISSNPYFNSYLNNKKFTNTNFSFKHLTKNSIKPKLIFRSDCLRKRLKTFFFSYLYNRIRLNLKDNRTQVNRLHKLLVTDLNIENNNRLFNLTIKQLFGFKQSNLESYDNYQETRFNSNKQIIERLENLGCKDFLNKKIYVMFLEYLSSSYYVRDLNKLKKKEDVHYIRRYNICALGMLWFYKVIMKGQDFPDLDIDGFYGEAGYIKITNFAMKLVIYNSLERIFNYKINKDIDKLLRKDKQGNIIKDEFENNDVKLDLDNYNFEDKEDKNNNNDINNDIDDNKSLDNMLIPINNTVINKTNSVIEVDNEDIDNAMKDINTSTNNNNINN